MNDEYVIKYIIHYYQQYSRYDIDLHLISEGYPAFEIDAAWEYMADDSNQINSAKLKKLLNKLWVIFFISSYCIITFFLICSFYFWPFVLHRSDIAFTALLTIFLNGCFSFYAFYRDRLSLTKLLIVLLMLSVQFFLLVVVTWLGMNNGLKEIASTSAEGHDYHLIVFKTCWSYCEHEGATLYKCNVSNIVCTNVGKITPLIISEDYGPKPGDKEVYLNHFKKTNISVDPQKRTVEVIQENEIRYTFHLQE